MHLETPRLTIRPFALTDATFVLRLLNEPTFIANIADKGVRSLADAEDYLRNGPLASYAEHGFGLCLIELKPANVAIGMCGLLKRDYLDQADIGYALLPEHCAFGYAHEAATAVIAQARASRRIPRLLAIVSPDNQRSINLLQKLGFAYQRVMTMEDSDDQVSLFSADLQQPV